MIQMTLLAVPRRLSTAQSTMHQIGWIRNMNSISAPTPSASTAKTIAAIPEKLSTIIHVVRSAHAIQEVFSATVDLLLDQTVDVGPESREAGVELPSEAQVAHDRSVDTLARDQQRDARRVRRQQYRRHAALELVDRHAVD